MVQVEKKRTALLLYAILVVLPAVVFGGLHWHQLKADHENRRQSIPVDAASAASRVRAGIVDFVAELLREQMAVEYYEYRPLYLPKNSPDRLTVLRSALSEGQLPEGVRAYFTYPFLEGSDGPSGWELLEGWKSGEPIPAIGDEATLLRLAAQLEEMARWTEDRPPVCVGGPTAGAGG